MIQHTMIQHTSCDPCVTPALISLQTLSYSNQTHTGDDESRKAEKGRLGRAEQAFLTPNAEVAYSGLGFLQVRGVSNLAMGERR